MNLIDKKYFSKIMQYLKLPLSLLLLYLVFIKTDLRSLGMIFSAMDFDLLVTLLLLSIVKIILQFFNWHMFLHSFQGNRIPLKESIIAFFSGTSLRIVTPGGFGVYGRVMMLNTHKKHSFLAISYEKVIQSWAILLYAALALFLKFSSTAFLFLFLLFILFPIILLFMPKTSKAGSFLPINKLSIIPNTVIQSLINFITIFQYFIFIGSFACFTFKSALMTVPIVQFANMIPITFSGLGLREQIAISIYPPLGVTEELAVSCSIFIFAISNLIPALTGIVFLIMHKQKNK